jgi:hypothetical protein
LVSFVELQAAEEAFETKSRGRLRTLDRKSGLRTVNFESESSRGVPRAIVNSGVLVSIYRSLPELLLSTTGASKSLPEDLLEHSAIREIYRF